MIRRPPKRLLVLLTVAGLAAAGAALQVSRSKEARGLLSDLLAGVVAPVAGLWAEPTPAERRAAEFARRLKVQVPRPERERYPDRPRVAVMDFEVDADTWVGEQTAQQLSDATRATLEADGRFDWVDRSQLDVAADELALGLGAGDASALVELGAWLKCDLIVTGRFVDTGRSTQRLRLEVVDLLTADRVTTRELDWPPDLRRPERLPDAQMDRLTDAASGVVAAAHERLTALRDAPVVSLLFFRNVTGHDRLDHLQTLLPERLEQHARATPDVRLVRIGRPGHAGDEQTLALTGLTRADPQAWARAADHYLWGHFAEAAPASAGDAGTAVVDPDTVPVTATLYLWSGSGAPRAFTRTAPRSGIEAAVDGLAEEAWRAAQAPVADTVSPGQRDAAVALLRGRAEAQVLNVAGRPGPAHAGRVIVSGRDANDALARQAAWFLRPEDEHLAEASLFHRSPPPAGRKWIGLRAEEARVDRVIARFGPSPDGRGTVERKLRLLDARVALARGSNFSASSTFGRGRVQLPNDMPPAARAAYRQETLDRLIELGRAAAARWRSTDQASLPPHRRGRGPSLRPDDVLLRGLRLTPTETADVWSAWWPLLEPAWERECERAHRIHFDHTFLDRLSAAYQTAGRSAEYDAMFAETPEPVAVAYRAPTPTADEAAHLRAWVDRRVADGRLKRGVPRTPPAPGARPDADAPPLPAEAGRSRLDTVRDVVDNPDVPAALRVRIRRAAKLNDARFGGNASPRRRVPRHPAGPPVVSADGASSLGAAWPADAPRELSLAPRSETLSYRAIARWNGRYAALRADHRRGQPPGRQTVAHNGLGVIDPLTLLADPLHHRTRPTRWVTLAATGDRLWLATDRDGLRRLSPGNGPTLRLGPERGLVSADIRQLAFDGAALWMLSGDGRLGLIPAPGEAADALGVRDVRLPERFESEHLAAADGRAAVRRRVGEGQDDGDWYWVDAAGITPLRDGAVGARLAADDAVVSVRGDGDAFWVVTTTRLLRVSGDGAVRRDLPLPAPPLDTLRVRGDGERVWLAYPWDVPGRDGPGGVPHRPTPVESRTRLVLADASTGAVLGQTEWPGRLHDLFVTPDELHLWMPHGEHDLVMVRRAGLLDAMGVSPAVDADRAEPPPPAGVGGAAWSAYRGRAAAPDAMSDAPADGDWPPVLAAVRAGRADTLADLLAAGHDPNAAVYGINGHSAALLAVLTDRIDLLDLLHAAGARLNETHPTFGTLGHAAVLAGSARGIAWLGAHGCDLDAPARIADRRGFRSAGESYPYRCAPLHLAVARGDPAAVRALLDAGASNREDRLADDRMIPLLRALRNGDALSAAALLDHGADPRRARDRWGSALDAAAEHADPALLRRIVAAGVDPQNAAALYTAVKRGDAELVAVLRAAGLDPAARADPDEPALRHAGDIPLVRAVAAHRPDLYDQLLAGGGVDLDRTYGGRWRLGDLVATAMVEARFFDRAIELVAAGYSVDVPDAEGETLLLRTAARASTVRANTYRAQAELLLALGADPSARNDDRQSVVSVTEHPELRALLLDPEPRVSRMRGGAE